MYQNIRTIKVGTFNLMNFMLPNKPVYGGSLVYTQDEYRRKSDWVEFMLNEMDADIIGFQELFHSEAMWRIIHSNPKYRHAKLYMAEETGDQPSVALLSRFPVENMEVFTHFPENAVIDFNPKGRERVTLPFTTFTRPVIKADVLIPKYGVITVFVVHLKSKREIFYAGEDTLDPVDLARAQSRSLMLRASESVAVRALVADALKIPNRPVILCGDVNDTGNAVTSRIISGEVPQHRLADNIKRQMWDLLLYHVKDIQARRSYQDFYYTHIHNGMYESLDHIMVSQELVTEYPRNTGRVGLVTVYNDHLVDQTYTNRGADKCKSDHGVVVCSIELDLDRAARFMKDTDGRVQNSDYVDYEDTVSRLEEHENGTGDPFKDDPFYADDETDIPAESEETAEKQEAVDEGAGDAQNTDAKGFNLDESLARWRENHPESSRPKTYRGRKLFTPPRYEDKRQTTHENRKNNADVRSNPKTEPAPSKPSESPRVTREPEVKSTPAPAESPRVRRDSDIKVTPDETKKQNASEKTNIDTRKKEDKRKGATEHRRIQRRGPIADNLTFNSDLE